MLQLIVLYRKICIMRFYSTKYQRYENLFDNFFGYTMIPIITEGQVNFAAIAFSNVQKRFDFVWLVLFVNKLTDQLMKITLQIVRFLT